MTLTDLPAIFHRAERKHRTGDTIRKLRRQVAKLEAKQRAADDYFRRLLIDRGHVYRAYRFAEQKRQEAEQVAMCALEESARLTAEVTELRTQLAPYLAAEANAHPIDVPPMQRDTTAVEDQATGPIDVRPLWAARDAGLLRPAADPDRMAAT